MSNLRQKIAQMLIMGFSGTAINDDSDVASWLSDESIGGVILFDYDIAAQKAGKNLINQAQIKTLTSQLKYYAHLNQENSNLPLFIAIDYEGGAVDRLKNIEGCSQTKRPSDLALLSTQELKLEAKKMASTLKNLGFNLNFAPVVDLNLNEKEGIIGKLGRSFSNDPEKVAATAKTFVNAFADEGMTTCYKHFPGHGSASGDTHEGFVDVTNSFNPSELEPYNQLLKAEDMPAMVMTAHVINKQLDESGLPATLSKTILTRLLRHKIGYKGVIVSDDLQMFAIAKHYSLKDSLSLTINAGADMLIFGNQFGSISATTVIDAIETLVEEGVIEHGRIDEAFNRIRTLKTLKQPFLQD
ncbi:MAG: glycoside hydrolase family 3 protein [Proteobacteria bacterium]|nr:glycoside hydrolase family 3 protein [Pseudomonadota bacterium]